MTFVDTYDLMDGKVGQADQGKRLSPIQLLMLKLAKQRIHPAPNEGWHTQGNNSDSEAEGDGQSVPATSASSSTQN